MMISSGSTCVGTDFVGRMCFLFGLYFRPSGVLTTYDLGVSCLRSTVPCFHLLSCRMTTFSPFFQWF